MFEGGRESERASERERESERESERERERARESAREREKSAESPDCGEVGDCPPTCTTQQIQLVGFKLI